MAKRYDLRHNSIFRESGLSLVSSAMGLEGSAADLLEQERKTQETPEALFRDRPL